MELFTCERCSNVLFFENSACEKCGATLGYNPDTRAVTAIQPGKHLLRKANQWCSLDPSAGNRLYRQCRNTLERDACNWLVPMGDPHEYCKACRLSEAIPDLSNAETEKRWRRLETAKRRLVYSLDVLGLPVRAKVDGHLNGLTFRFLQDTPNQRVSTGHDNGVITINVDEADGSLREHTREMLGEAYRTILGHFRHEIGHYYWDVLIRDSTHLAAFRDLFGDERQSYAEAIERHYQQGPLPNWQQSFVSAYASMHPWEDWAETWAHYLHMMDTLSTASSHGLTVRQLAADGQGERAAPRQIDFADFDAVMQAWYPVTLALNSLSRSMGVNDMYPFALSPAFERKLRFVHQMIRL